MSDFIVKYSDLNKVPNSGMGEVFHAFDHSLNMPVIIKKLPLDHEDNALSLKQFQNEMHNFSQLQHPNIVRIIDYGNDENSFFIVTEFIDGYDLNDLMSEINFNRDVYLMIVFKALIALGFSHECGLVHGNIKPSNLLIDKNGRVVVTDFGISQVKKYAFIPENINKNLNAKYFIAPEQVNTVAQQAGLVYDKCTENNSFIYNHFSTEQHRVLSRKGLQYDIWSAGVVLFRLCMGYYPFDNRELSGLLSSIINLNLQKTHEFMPNLPDQVSVVIHRCLEKNPEKRPGSISMVTNALQNYFYLRGIIDIDEVLFGYIRNIVTLNQINRKYNPSGLSSMQPAKIAAEQVEIITYKDKKITQYESSPDELSVDVDLPWSASAAGNILKFVKPVLIITALIIISTAVVVVYKMQLHQFIRNTSDTFEYKHVPVVKPEIQTFNPATLQSQNPETASFDSEKNGGIDKTRYNRENGLQIKGHNKESSDNYEYDKDIKQHGILIVNVNPSDAQVYIDNIQLTRKEKTEGKKLVKGKHSVSAKSSGYEEYKRLVIVEQNKTLELDLELRAIVKRSGQLHIYSDPWANLYIDDELIGTTPTPSPVMLGEGRHKVILVRDGYQTHKEYVNIADGTVSRLQIQLKESD